MQQPISYTFMGLNTCRDGMESICCTFAGIKEKGNNMFWDGKGRNNFGLDRTALVSENSAIPAEQAESNGKDIGIKKTICFLST